MLHDPLFFSSTYSDRIAVAELLVAKGETGNALALQRQVLAEFVEIGDNQGIASALEAIGQTLLLVGTDPTAAIHLISAAGALRQKIHIRLGPARIAALEKALAKAKKTLGKATYETAFSSGRTAAIKRSIDLALIS